MTGCDLAEEFIGCDGLSRFKDVVDDVAEGVVVDGLSRCLGDGVYLVGEVVAADGESELGVTGDTSHVVAVG